MLSRRRVRGGLTCLIAVAAMAPVVVLPTPAAQASTVASRTSTVLVIRSPAIDEDSALVSWNGLFVTTNDSGDTGRVFLVGRGGRTVGVTHWSKHPSDCEALAPGDPGKVWVGDIGDNFARRPSISISEVPVGRHVHRVHVPQYRLVYPDGPVNAETLVRNPNTGRLYIATKEDAGGTLYAVPRDLSRHHVNVLKPIATGVPPLATDGAFFPGGHFLVIRGYRVAVVYTWPLMTRVGHFDLPLEQQGEGLATDSRGSVFLSSEGIDQPVLHLRMPPWLRRTVKAGSTGETLAPTWARRVPPLVGG